jgi:hypothetical protein
MAAIPKKWIASQGLERGDHIEIEWINNYLIVSANPIVSEKKIEITIDDAEQIGILRLLQVIYDAGFTDVDIRFKKAKVLTSIYESLKWLPGFRIDSLTDFSCKLMSVSSQIDVDLEFKKAFQSTKQLTDVISRYLGGDSSVVPEVKTMITLCRDRSAEVKRKINTSRLPLEYKYYYFIAIQFEEIAEQYLYLFRSLEKKKRNHHLFVLHEKLRGLFNETYNQFYDFHLQWLINSNRGLIWKWFDTTKNPKQVYHLRAISERVKNIMKYTAGIRLK